MHRDQAVRLAGGRDRHQVPQRIVAHGAKVRRDGEVARRGIQERVPVGLGLGDGARSHRSARAGPVLHHHRHAEAGRERARHDARHVVVGGARREGADVADRTLREGAPPCARAAMAKGMASPAPSSARRVAGRRRRRSSRGLLEEGGEKRGGWARPDTPSAPSSAPMTRTARKASQITAPPRRPGRPGLRRGAPRRSPARASARTARRASGAPADWRGHARGCRRAACSAPPRAPRSRP